jgi:hypothetical protein
MIEGMIIKGYNQGMIKVMSTDSHFGLSFSFFFVSTAEDGIWKTHDMTLMTEIIK